MIINVSRVKAYNSCHQRAFNQFHRGLEGQRSMNLVDGGAFHDGIAYGMAKKDWEGAYDAAMLRFEKDVQAASIPPEQTFLIDQHRDLVRVMIDEYKRNYGQEDYEVIQPECEFDVILPGGRHNCIWMHWIDIEDDEERWGPPDPEKILRHSVMNPHIGQDYATASQCPCYQPHRFVGKTDNVIAWKHNIWLQEHKTTAIAGPQFWDQWLIDVQPTAYMYGVWKSIAVRPSGFILNALIKPSEAQVASYNKKRKYGDPKSVQDYVQFERQAFLRTEEDLHRVERQLVNVCNEWEMRIRGELEWDMTPTQGACMAYNRRCDYFSMCLSHDEPREMAALGMRTLDYVNEKLVRLIPKKESA